VRKNFKILNFFTILFLTLQFQTVKTLSQIPEIWIRPTPNTTLNSIENLNKTSISNEISNYFGINDVKSALSFLGVNSFQSGSIGQQTSVFMRGTNSNHTLTLLNGIPINDQSTTNGLYDFGQDFFFNISAIEVYKGPSSVNFGPDAIGGAVNYITVPQNKNYFNYGKTNGNSLGNLKFNQSNSINGTNFNFQGGLFQSKDSSAMVGSEKDLVKNKSGTINIQRWLSDNISVSTTFLGRQTFSEIDNSTIKQTGYDSNTLFGAIQGTIDYITKDTSTTMRLHSHVYDRNYNSPNNEFDEYNSKSYFVRLEHNNNFRENLSFGIGSDYKIDSANFINRGSYNSSLNGDYNTLSYFGNLNYNFHKELSGAVLLRNSINSLTENFYDYKLSLKKDKILDFVDIKISQSTGHKNPSLYELYGADNFGYRGNKNLKAEQSKTNELSTFFNLNNNNVLGLTFFNTDIKNLITYRNNTYNNTSGISEQEGIELNHKYTQKDFSLNFFGNHIRSKDNLRVLQLRRPENSLGLMLKDNISEKSSYFLNYSYSGNYFDTHSSSYSRIKMKEINIFDIGLGYDFFGTDLFLSIKNLFDENYEKPHGYSQKGREFSFNISRKY